MSQLKVSLMLLKWDVSLIVMKRLTAIAAVTATSVVTENDVDRMDSPLAAAQLNNSVQQQMG